MSLINEALKKAQRVRHEDATGSSVSTGAGSGGIAKRGKAQSANTMVLLGSGALVLVVLSVVVTVYLVNRPSKPVARVTSTAVPPVVEKTASPTPAPESSAPLLIPPNLTVPKTTPLAESATPPSTPPGEPAEANKPSPAPNPTTATTPAVAPVTPASTKTSPDPVAPLPAAPAGPNERVTAFVEGIRVTGIRSSGAESRVLMNERVYRVNDVVERNLGVRLIKVAADSLTFSDANGITYVKSF